MTLAGAVASGIPGAGAALEYRREPLLAGEIWRPLTGQMVHWSSRMALLDLGAVLLLGGWLELRAPRLARWTLLAGAGVVAAGLPFLTPRGSAYRGASGLATALLVALALRLATTAAARSARRVAWAVLLLLAGKIAAEAITGRALAAGPLPAGVAVAPLVHALGAAAGAMAAGLTERRRKGARLTAPPGTPP